MSATIYGILSVADISQKELKKLLGSAPVKTGKHTYDGSALYDEITRRFGWLPSTEQNNSICLWGSDQSEVCPVTLPDDTPAGMFVHFAEPDGKPLGVCILDLSENEDSAKLRLVGFKMRKDSISVVYASDEDLYAEESEGFVRGWSDDEPFRESAYGDLPREDFIYRNRTLRLLETFGIRGREVLFSRIRAVPAECFSRS